MKMIVGSGSHGDRSTMLSAAPLRRLMTIDRPLF